MGFGISILNNTSEVIISDATYNMQVVEKVVNAVPVISEAGYNDYYEFLTPVATQDPPMVFIRDEVGTGATTLRKYYKIVGSPGNWIGFGVMQCTFITSGNYITDWGRNHPYYRLSYMVGVRPSTLTEDFGLALYDASGKLQYTSDKPLISLRGSSEGFTGDGRLVHEALFYKMPRPANSFYLAQGGGIVWSTSSRNYAQLYIGTNQSTGDIRMLVDSRTSGGPWYGYNPFMMIFADDI